MPISRILIGIALLVALVAAATIPTVMVLGTPRAQAGPNCAQYHQKAIQAATDAGNIPGGLQGKQGRAQESMAWSAVAANCVKFQ